ncbi:hypothetical protein GH733_018137, partial [Mirounga leonina]
MLAGPRPLPVSRCVSSGKSLPPPGPPCRCLEHGAHSCLPALRAHGASDPQNLALHSLLPGVLSAFRVLPESKPDPCHYFALGLET